MEKTKFAIGVDETMRTIAIWLLCAVILRYFIKELLVIVVFATLATALITFAIRRALAKKNISASKQRQVDDAMRRLVACDRLALLRKIARSVGGVVRSKTVLTDSVAIYPYFFGKLSLEALNGGYNTAKKNGKKLLVLCSDVSPEVENNVDLFCDIPLRILSKKDSYAFLEKYGALPDTTARPKKRVRRGRRMLKKSKIKGYLACAILLLLTASFSPYAIVCIVAAAVNITLSILCFEVND